MYQSIFVFICDADAVSKFVQMQKMCFVVDYFI